MVIFSLNVNGLKSSIEKGLLNFIDTINPDILCLQEIKCQEPLLSLKDYYCYWNYCSKKGYSGTAIFTKFKPRSVTYGFANELFDSEGRIITLEYDSFFLVNVYVPNSKSSLARIDYRMKWDEIFFDYIMTLEKNKAVIICGDFNIALTEIDSNDENYISEFIDNERDEFDNFLNNDFIDAYRYKNPYEKNCFTWWSIGKKTRNNKIGYRLDYFLVSQSLKDHIINSKIFSKINCSDHCPISLEIDLKVSSNE